MHYTWHHLVSLPRNSARVDYLHTSLVLQALLDVVLRQIVPHSLPAHTLDDSRYLDLAKVVNTSFMVMLILKHDFVYRF